MQSHHAIVLRNRVTKSRDAVSWGSMISFTYDCTKSEHKEIQDAFERGAGDVYRTCVRNSKFRRDMHVGQCVSRG
jgi:hypothetical protein